MADKKIDLNNTIKNNNITIDKLQKEKEALTKKLTEIENKNINADVNK